MAGRLSDTVTERAERAFVGRREEIAVLAALLRGRVPLVAHLHGIGGIGKTTLLDAFSRTARRRGATVFFLDCRTIEPTERGLLDAIATSTGAAGRRLGSIVAAIRGRRRVLFLFDNYEVLQLADAWIRQTLIPTLPSNARVVLSGRTPPSPAWTATPGSERWFRSVPLGPLEAEDAVALLKEEGLRREEIERIRRFAAGHPLALKLAAWTLTHRPRLEPCDAEFQSVIDALVERFVRDVDPTLRRALDACAVVRRVTRSLLAAMLGEEETSRAVGPLGALPFVESAPDGLVLHESVRTAIAASLRATDPARYRAFRLAAWSQLRREVRAAGVPDLWRYTADLLFLVQSPVIREAFFPSAPTAFTVESARPEDDPAIDAIAERHESRPGASLLGAWRRAAPASFHVARDARGAVVGFYCLLDAALPRWSPANDDPIVRRWLDHLRADPVPSGQRVLFLRRWLAAGSGERVSPVQAACFLDIKRIYLELRPRLRRVYVAFCDPAVWFPIVENLGFGALETATAEVGGRTQHSAMVDMGPASVDGWLSAIAARELGVDETDRLDASARAVRVDGRPVPLTRLEFALLQFLRERPGEAVPRDVLRREVWGHRGSESSNVVDVVVRSLRRKLGARSSTIESVRGVGYRYAS